MDNEQIKKESNIGPVIGSIIIIILLALGGLYFWGYVVKNQTPETPVENIENIDQVNTEEIADPEIAEINNELNSAITDEIDNELNQIDAEIDAALE